MEDILFDYLKDGHFIYGMVTLWILSLILQAMPNPGPNANIWLRWLYAIAQGFGANVTQILAVFKVFKKK